MPSGHHQVADALIDSIQGSEEEIECKKVDFLSYWNETLERTIGKMYLKWISSLPKTYHWVYKHFMYETRNQPIPMQLDYVQLLGFEAKMLEMIEEEQPDLIVCTHCFPSGILDRLKRDRRIDIPTVNVYTDFFINGIWGKEHIDLHLVNDEPMKQDLVNNHGVSEDQIVITGIPTSEDIVSYTVGRMTVKKHILIAGGSSGVGNILDYLKTIRSDSRYHYTVLCGKNDKLYKELNSWEVPHIEPRPYIDSRGEMNRLYEQADAIITKPGGITISEALKKRLLIFVHSALPGQEQYNLKGLSEQQLIIPIEAEDFERTIAQVLDNNWRRKQIFQRMDEYLDSKESCPKNEIVKLIEAPSMLSVQPG